MHCSRMFVFDDVACILLFISGTSSILSLLCQVLGLRICSRFEEGSFCGDVNLIGEREEREE